MEVVRHRLTAPERQELESILQLLPGMSADAPLPPASNPEILSAQERAHRLDLAPDTLRGLRKLFRQFALPERQTNLLILEGLPMTHKAASLMLLIGSLFGEVREFIGHGAPVVEVADRGQIVHDRPSSDNALEFRLHTDLSFYENPPGYIAFLMRRQGAEGGESLFCDPGPLLRGLTKATLEALQSDYEFPASLHRPDLGAQSFPILTPAGDGSYNLRYRRDGLKPLSKTQADALEAFTREIDARAISFALAPGEMAVFSNHRLLHGRKRFRNTAVPAQARNALRAYLGLARPGLARPGVA